MLEQQIEADIKTALLAGDKAQALTLRTIKSVLLSAKVNGGKRDSGLSDEEVVALLAKESKKRQESADLYIQGGSQDRANAELAEKAVIDAYLPQPLSEAELATLVTTTISELTASGQPLAMGAVIASVRAQAGAGADGATIARLVKEKIS